MNKDCIWNIVHDVSGGLMIFLIGVQGGMSWKSACVAGVILAIKSFNSYLENTKNIQPVISDGIRISTGTTAG